MITNYSKSLDLEAILENLMEDSIKIAFNPINKKWRYEAQHNHLYQPLHEGVWRATFEEALADAIEYHEATR